MLAIALVAPCLRVGRGLKHGGMFSYDLPTDDVAPCLRVGGGLKPATSSAATAPPGGSCALPSGGARIETRSPGEVRSVGTGCALPSGGARIETNGMSIVRSRSRITRAPKAGEIGIEEASASHFHQVAERIADAWGVDYE